MSKVLALLALCALSGVLAAPVPWSYEQSNNGPLVWGEISKDYALCKTGSEQSPTDLWSVRANGRLPKIRFQYDIEVPVIVVNDGHIIKLVVEEDKKQPNPLRINWEGRRYTLTDVEFHTPSEHKELGITYPLEVQLKHKPEDSLDPLVISVFYMFGEEPHEVLSRFVSGIPSSAGTYTPTGDQDDGSVGPLRWSPKELLPVLEEGEGFNYYQYKGSLTAPPCTEGVQWLVMKHHGICQDAQVQAFRNAVGETARPTQRWGERVGELSAPVPVDAESRAFQRAMNK